MPDLSLKTLTFKSNKIVCQTIFRLNRKIKHQLLSERQASEFRLRLNITEKTLFAAMVDQEMCRKSETTVRH